MGPVLPEVKGGEKKAPIGVKNNLKKRVKRAPDSTTRIPCPKVKGWETHPLLVKLRDKNPIRRPA